MTKVVTGTYDEEGNRSAIAEAMNAFGTEGYPIATGEPMKWEGPVPTMREWVGELEDVVLLVHPLDGETVVDTLRRHFEAAGMGTVTVATADGPRDVDVPAALAGVKVIESTVVPLGEIRLSPSLASLVRVGKVTL